MCCYEKQFDAYHWSMCTESVICCFVILIDWFSLFFFSHVDKTAVFKHLDCSTAQFQISWEFYMCERLHGTDYTALIVIQISWIFLAFLFLLYYVIYLQVDISEVKTREVLKWNKAENIIRPFPSNWLKCTW